MAGKTPKAAAPKQVEALDRDEAKRKNIPTAEYQPVLDKHGSPPVRVSCPRAAERSASPVQAPLCSPRRTPATAISTRSSSASRFSLAARCGPTSAAAVRR